MAGFVDIGCAAPLSLAPVFMPVLPPSYMPPRAEACVSQQSSENSDVLVKNICACTMTEMCPGETRWHRPEGGDDGYFFDSDTATTCTLVASTDHGATLGTCTDSDTTDTAYCTYIRGSYCWSTGTLDTVAISDSCTSVAEDGGAEIVEDTTNCYLTRSTDYGTTPGSCDSNDAAAYSCTYVPGTYCSSTGVPDTQIMADSCTSTTVDGDATETEADTVNCVLTGSNDFGVTPGTCADVNSGVATCEYVPGMYRVEAAKDVTPRDNTETCVVVTPPTADECTTGAFVAPPPPPPPPEPAPAANPAPAPAATSAASARLVAVALLAAAAAVLA